MLKTKENAFSINYHKRKKMMKYILIFLFTILSLSGKAQFTKMLDFAGTSNGSYPCGAFLNDGTFLYAMTSSGGANNVGIIFKIKPDGSNYNKLLDFDATNGSNPCGSLVFDSTFFYGMTETDGAHNGGTIFKIKPDGSNFTKLWDFDIINGGNPYGSLIIDGNYLYGTTNTGGSYNEGVVFKIMTDGSGYTKLLTFNDINGSDPNCALIYDGNFLYGTTIIGGTNGLGTIFKIKPDGSGYVKLLDFAGTINGSMPYGSLISDGLFLYGMTYQGGINNKGTIFKIMPDGSNYFKLFDFSGTLDGSTPYGSLLYDSIFLYGVTMQGGINNNGVIFRIKTNGSDYTKMLDFAGVSNGNLPKGSLISDGSFLFGMTTRGGNNDLGVIYKLAITSNIEETRENANITFNPNPASNILNIECPEGQNLNLSVYNIVGECLLQKAFKSSKETIDISNFPSGIYIIKVSDNNHTVQQKLIKE
jgi:uncharacterized repeat protein (TIGR03803 family)